MNPNRPAPPTVEGGVDDHQLRPAQHVVHDEQLAGVGAVGEVAGADRADDVEHADQGQVAGGRRRRRRGGRAAADMKWVWISPFVDSPQTKKLPNRSQNVPLCHASAEGTERGPDRLDVAGVGQRGRSLGRRRTGSRPDVLGTVAEEDRRRSARPQGADGDRDAHPAPADPLGQPATAGAGTRAARWPSPRSSAPVTRPRRATNQRLATVEAKTVAMQPDPIPTTTPHSRNSCHGSVIRVVPSAPSEMATSAHDGDPAQAVAGLQRGGERSDEAEEQQVDADGRADRGPGPAELLAQRIDEDPRRRTEPRRAEQRDERRGEDDPRVVEPPRPEHAATVATGFGPDPGRTGDRDALGAAPQSPSSVGSLALARPIRPRRLGRNPDEKAVLLRGCAEEAVGEERDLAADLRRSRGPRTGTGGWRGSGRSSRRRRP